MSRELKSGTFDPRRRSVVVRVCVCVGGGGVDLTWLPPSPWQKPAPTGSPPFLPIVSRHCFVSTLRIWPREEAASHTAQQGHTYSMQGSLFRRCWCHVHVGDLARRRHHHRQAAYSQAAQWLPSTAYTDTHLTSFRCSESRFRVKSPDY